MMPDTIIEIIDEHLRDQNVKAKDVVMIKRYFIRMFCGWIPLRAIAEMTGVKDHHTVLWSIRKIEHEKQFVHIREKLSKIIKQRIKLTTAQ